MSAPAGLGRRLVATPLIGLLVLAAPVSASSSFKTGTYTGKTSQKTKVGFEVAEGTLDCLGVPASKPCLFQLDSQSTNLMLPCPGGSQDGVQELLDPVAIPGSGVVSQSFGSTGAAGRLTYSIRLRSNGTLTGYFEESFSSGGGAVCKSGKVSFSATRTSGVRR